jgi:tetratricopeptide (TPR) repeat protein
VSEIEKKEDLQTDYTLTGNYLKEANTIRLNIELIDNDSNKMIWQESIEQAFENTFKLQDIVSEIVVDGLKINFSTDEQDHMRVDLPHNPQAYDYYLRSLSYSSDTKDDSLAIEILKKSIQIDSSYAPVYDELGFRTLRFGQGVFKIASDYGQAERYFLKALSINSDLITSLNYLSGIYTEIGEIEKAMDLAHKALDINPNNAYTHLILSYNYRYVGMLNNSKKEAEIALRIDPHNPRFRSFGHTYLYLREYKKAIEMYDLDEKSIWSLCKKSVTFLRNGQIDEAIVHANRAIEKNPKGQWGLFSSIIKAYIEGNIEKGIKMNLKWELAKPYDSETLYYIASNYGLLGETAGCVRVLRKAVEGGFFCYPFFLTDPFLDPMRDDPEFQEVLALAREKA